MTNNDLFYVCALVEYIARQTKNHHLVIAEALGVEGIRKLLKDAPVNHCLSFEQVSAEVVAAYHIPQGEFDAISQAKYTVPNFQDIGKLYAILIEMTAGEKTTAQAAFDLFSSFLCKALSNFNSDLYYQNPDYLAWCYREGKIL